MSLQLNNPFLLADTFEEEFNLQLNQLKRFTNHGPSLGRYVELLLINLLNKYCPKSIHFSSGFIYPMNPRIKNGASSQIDIICFDRQNYPILFDSNELIVTTPKSVKGMIEVKSTLDKKSINQIIKLSESSIFNEIGKNVKIYLISSKSNISPKFVFEYLTEYYSSKPEMKGLFGSIYSLDWDEFICFNIRQSESPEEISIPDKLAYRLTYSILRLSRLSLPHSVGLSDFISKLIIDLFGSNIFKSIGNVMAPSIYKIQESHDVVLYTDTPNILSK